MFAIPVLEKSAENVVQAYPSGIFTHKGGRIALIIDKGSVFQNTVSNDTCEQLGIKRL